MYIHIDLPCKRETQRSLHQTFRHRIKKWKKSNIVNRAVLTYHYSYPPQPTDSLYLCLDISTVVGKTGPETELSQYEMNQIPPLIINCVREVCHRKNINPRFTDYELEIELGKRSKEKKGIPYYNGAPVKDILHFASFGTKVAFEVLDQLEENGGIFKSDMDLSRYILSRLKEEFGAHYKWMIWALHFVCNPLRIREDLIMYPQFSRALQIIRSDL